MKSPLPDDPSQCASRSFERLYRTIEAYRRYVPNRSLLYFEAFALVAARSQIRSSDIARILGMDKAAVTKALDNLGPGGPRLARLGINFGVGADVLGYAPDPSDTRAKLVELTLRGNELAAEMRASMNRRSSE